MEKPYKTVVNERVVFLCCNGCETELKRDPETYLAKLERIAPGSAPKAVVGDRRKTGPKVEGVDPEAD